VKLQWKSKKIRLNRPPKRIILWFIPELKKELFDNGVLVNTSQYTLKLKPGTIYSFKVTDSKQGGESFPSEILSVYRDPNEKEQY
jgi:hypothetical protein